MLSSTFSGRVCHDLTLVGSIKKSLHCPCWFQFAKRIKSIELKVAFDKQFKKIESFNVQYENKYFDTRVGKKNF